MTNSHSLTERIKSFSLYFVVLAIAAMSLLILPITINFIFLSKVYLAFAVALAILFLFALTAITKQKFEFVGTPFMLPLSLFGLALLVSIFFTTNYPVENLLGLGGVYLSFVVIALFGGSVLPRRRSYPAVIWGLVATAVLLTLTGFLTMLGFGPEKLLNRWFGLQLPSKSLLFSLAGSSLIAVQVILLGLIAALSELKRSLVSQHKPTLLAAAITSPILILGFALYVWALLPSKTTSFTFQPPMAAWSVTLDSLRLPKQALIGVGPEGYSDVYHRFKPVWMNKTKFWNANYTQSSITPLTILVTTGFVGLAIWLAFIFKTAKEVSAKENEHKVLSVLILASLLMQLLLPINAVILTIEALLLAVYAAAESHRYKSIVVQPLVISKENDQWAGHQWPQMVLGGLLLIAVIAGGYFVARSYQAYYYLNQASLAAKDNQGVKIYNYSRRAVQLNPYIDTFRRQYALINLSFATVLTNKAKLKDADKKQITKLLQLASQEAKAATILDPNDWRNWATLAQVYQNMIGVAKDADQWTIQAYVKAIEHNPNDPTLRVALGGVFFNKKDYQQAVSIFSQAVSVKPNYANSYYNLAVTLTKLRQWAQAKKAYQTLLSLLKPDSDNYIKVTKQMKQVDAQLAKIKAQQKTKQVKVQPSGKVSQPPSITDQKLKTINQDVVKPSQANSTASPVASQSTQAR